MLKKTIFILALIPLFFAWSYSFALNSPAESPICFIHDIKSPYKLIGSISMTDRYILLNWNFNSKDHKSIEQGWIQNYEALADRITADTYLEVFDQGHSANIILTKSFLRIFPKYKNGEAKNKKPLLARLTKCPNSTEYSSNKPYSVGPI